MNREDRRQLLNEFRDALIGECLDRARDLEDVDFYGDDVFSAHRPWEIASEEEVIQKIRGAVRSCNNLNLKGSATKYTVDNLISVFKQARKRYGDDPVIMGIQRRMRKQA